MSFEALLKRMSEVNDLAKAIPAGDAGAADDKNIKDAAGKEGKTALAEGAAEGGDKGAEAGAGEAGAGDAGAAEAGDKGGAAAGGEGEAGAAGGDKGAAGGSGEVEEEDDEPMAKSFQIQLENGEVMEAVDGTQMLKAFGERMGKTEASFDETKGQMLKALNVAVDMLSAQSTQIKEQNQLIQSQAVKLTEQEAMFKALDEKIEQLGNAGRGRVSTLSVHEKPISGGETMSKAMDANAMQPNEILAKAQTALSAGRITGLEATGIETRVNMGLAVDATVLAKIQ